MKTGLQEFLAKFFERLARKSFQGFSSLLSNHSIHNLGILILYKYKRLMYNTSVRKWFLY
jgi:hypothetical protein